MVYNFRFRVVTRVLVITVFIAAVIYCVFETEYIVVPLICFACLSGAVTELILYLERSNQEFSNFLLSIKNSDFSKQPVVDKRGKSFSLFKDAQNIIVEKFQTIRIDKEAQYFYLETVIEHIQTAIISFDKSGKIIFANKAVKNLLHLPDFKNTLSLEAAYPLLYQHITTLEPGNNPVLELKRNGEKLKLSMRASKFIIHGVEHKLISMQNIRNEVESAELKAWEQLINVLTHEIMNSMTPISSLSSLLKDKADLLAAKKRDPDAISDLTEGLEVIERRSHGLMNFIEKYKKVNALPEPEFSQVRIEELFGRLKTLKEDELSKNSILFTTKINYPGLSLYIDAGLIEQVLLNLINNAMEALKDCTGATIDLSAEKSGNKLLISVKDNGGGISEADLGKIFIPFFSTKKTGSGIGLSLSRQIMRLHKGNISVSSFPGKKTVFILEFPLN